MKIKDMVPGIYYSAKVDKVMLILFITDGVVFFEDSIDELQFGQYDRDFTTSFEYIGCL